MTVTVRYFAAARELVGVESESLPVADGTTIAAVRTDVAARHPQLARLLPMCRLARNDAFATDDETVQAGDEILVLPPASGGVVRAQLLETPIVAGQAEALCELTGVGGIVTFTGTVRNHNLGKDVVQLEYTAYAPMAVREMEAIAAEALTKWPLQDVRVLHRVGMLQVGDIAVQIAVAGAHRAEPFEACRWVIDELKRRVPIWKKEFTADGATWLGSTP